MTVSARDGDRWTAPRPVSPSFEKPLVIACGDGFMLFWIGSYGVVMTQRLSPLGEPLGAMSAVPTGIDGPLAVAFNGSTFMLAQPYQSQVIVVRIDALGHMIDQHPFVIAEKTPVRGVAVASNGTDFLVAWYENTGVYAARVAGDGQLLDPVPMKVSPYFSSVQLASDHHDYVVKLGGGLARITASGTVSNGLLRIGDQVAMFDGDGRVLLAWQNDGSVVIESRDSNFNLQTRETLPWSDVPALADPDGEHILAAVSRLTSNPPLMPSRQIFAHVVEPDPQPARRRGSR